MKTGNAFTIAVLDDNPLFNTMLMARLKNFTGVISADKGIPFRIMGFTNPLDFITNVPATTNVAVIDYYLGDGYNGIMVLKKMQQQCSRCKVIMISQASTMKTSLVTILEGAYCFIPKDKKSLDNTCLAVEEVMRLQGILR